MELADLMVGDWVYISGKPVKITKDKLEMLLFIDDGSGISPIPLTKDILVKNSYKSTQGLDFYWLDDKKHCCIKNYDGKRLFCYKQGINDVWLIVKYVHQLQHLLQLCGIEKEITL